MVAAARAKDIEAYTEQDLPFHRLIVRQALPKNHMDQKQRLGVSGLNCPARKYN
jgi:hypothetical protein